MKGISLKQLACCCKLQLSIFNLIMYAMCLQHTAVASRALLILENT